MGMLPAVSNAMMDSIRTAGVPPAAAQAGQCDQEAVPRVGMPSPLRPGGPRAHETAARFARFCLLTLMLWAGTAWNLAVAAEAGPPPSFSFTGPEIFPVDFGVGNLRATDVDGDGLQDLVLANNLRSKITFLYNQTGSTNPATRLRVGKRNVNELPPDARFFIDSIASEKRIASLVVADLNDDERPDLAYYGEPKELVVQFNQGRREWSAPKRWSIDDGQLSPNSLGAGDLNGDGRTDLVLLGESQLYVFWQTEAGALSEPQRVPVTGDIKSVQVLDIDGNQLNDLLLVNWEHANPFRFRLQESRGHLGPEIRFTLPPVRSYWADDLDGDGKTELITIALNSGRAQIASFARKASEKLAEGLVAGQFCMLSLPKTSKAHRGQAWADLNGDGLSDLLVAEPDSGQLTVYLQEKDGALGPSKTFPSLTGVTDLLVRRSGTNAPAEIVLLSQEERQVASTRYEPDGRIPFPTPLALEGKPLAVATGSLSSNALPSLAVILDQDSRRSLWVRPPEGPAVTRPLSSEFKSNPSALRFHDADHDGRTDLVLLIPYEKVKILRQKEDLEFDELDIAPPGGSLEQPWMSLADVDGDGRQEMLLGQKNFVRAVVLRAETRPGTDTKPAWSFQVKDQINGVGSNSKIVAAAPLARGDDRVPWLFLLDAERKLLSLCRKDKAGVWEIQRNLTLPVTDFEAMQMVQRPAGPSLAFVGLNMVAWLTLAGEVWDLVERDGYETPIKDGRLFDVVSGDLNGDRRKDLVFLETAKNYLDLVLFQPDGTLVPANRWPVFEERSFRSRRAADQGEPREALIMDVTGDKKSDLVVLVHDRVLVYPQE